jgi:AhpD family alkylhydroperoxidase
MRPHEIIKNLQLPTRDLRRAIPDVYAGFSKMHDAALGDGALDMKTKELIALAVAVSRGCEGCIALHARTLANLEASDDEVAEALGVTIVMDGGPAASAYGPQAFEAFQQFTKAAERIAE